MIYPRNFSIDSGGCVSMHVVWQGGRGGGVSGMGSWGKGGKWGG